MGDSLRWVYVMSLPVSGSTILSLVANCHPGLVSPGELSGPGPVDLEEFPEGPPCSCGKRLEECPFWSEVVKAHRARGHEWKATRWGLTYQFDDHPLLGRFALSRPDADGLRMRLFERLPYFREKLQGLHATSASFARAVLEVSGKKVLLDASKQTQRIVHLARIPGIDLRAVHLIRHPGGYVYSLRRSRKVPVIESAKVWVSRNLEIERLLGGVPRHRVLRMRHEDFCDDTEGVMNGLYDFVGLPPAPIPDDLRDIQHHLFGNVMRSRGDKKVKRNDAFERELTADETAAYKEITGPLARRYGYAI